MKNVLLGCGVGVSAFVLVGCNQGSDQKLPDKPNVIFLVADDLGIGDLSCYGMRRTQTPNTDLVACEGLRFTDAHASAATSTPSRYALFTGHYNWRRNDTGIAPGDAAMIIRPEQTTVADMFKEAGYTTGAIGKWHLGMGDKQGEQDWNGVITPGPVDLGFDYSYLMAATGDRVPCVWIENGRVANYDPSAPIEVSYKEPFPGEPTGKTHPELVNKMKPSFGHDNAIVNGISRIGYMKGGGKALWQDEFIGDSITTKAVDFIERSAERPFFLYVGTNDIHVPRFPNPRFVGKSGMGYRGDAILEFDWTVGEIVKALKRRGIYENTLLVVTSDNGPVLDDGYRDMAKELVGDHKPSGIYRGGKNSIYEGGTRIPFIVHWPEVVKPGVSGALVSQIDLFASMVALIGGTLPEGAAPDSQDQLKALIGQDLDGREYIVESTGDQLSISTGKWKYMTRPFNKKKENKGRLFHLEDDIAETTDVLDRYPEVTERLKEIMRMEIGD